jgi:membrane protein
VERTGQRLTGVVGLAVVLYAVLRLFANVEKALGVIAGTRDRSPLYRRVRGYLVLLAMPALFLGVATFVVSLHGPVLKRLVPIVRALPGSAWVVGALAALASVALGLAILYASALPARIGRASVVTGAVVAAVLLALVLLAFVRFQIGVTRASTLSSGLAAVPVYLLWLFASWFVVLLGAEIAVGHDADRLLAAGVRPLFLDTAGQQVAAVAILERAARAAAAGAPPLTIPALSRALALFPGEVQALCERLCARGLLVHGQGQYRLGPAGAPGASDQLT